MNNEGKFIHHSYAAPGKEEIDMRKGPWTSEEDSILFNFISVHGGGRWDSLARCAGLKRTGKSCRFRWLNYLHPNIRRGNITAEEQILIFELHCRFGNRWSKIAEHLPGRTDNEIKNYWRTRVQKLAKQSECDVNSNEFKSVMQYIWLPRLMEQVVQQGAKPLNACSSNNFDASAAGANAHNYQDVMTESDILDRIGGIVPIAGNQMWNDNITNHGTIETLDYIDLSPSSILDDINWCNNSEDELIRGGNPLHTCNRSGYGLLGFGTDQNLGDFDDNMSGGLIWG